MHDRATPPGAEKSPAWQWLFAGRRGDYVLFALLGLGALFLFIWHVGAYAFSDPWEPKYAQAVREMMERGDYITPYHAGYIRWTKPILIYWLMLIPVQLWGNNEFTVRLPSVLAAVWGVLMLYYTLLKLRRRSTAMLGGCILTTLPLYFFMARQAMPDMLLTACLASAMCFFALGRFHQRRRRLHLALGYASVALAFLAKGPVAAVITLSAIILFWLFEFQPRQRLSWPAALASLRRTLSSYHLWSGLLLFAAIAAPWYVTIWIKEGHGFIDSFVLYENLQRFAAPIRGHTGTSAYFVKTIMHGTFLWGGFLPLAFVFLFCGHGKSDEAAKQKWYFLSWFLAIFLVFTLSGTKQDHYILPIMPSLAILIALLLESYFEPETPFWLRPMLLLSLAFAFLPIRDFLVQGNKYILDPFTIKRTIDHVEVEFALRCIFAAWAVVTVVAALRLRSTLGMTLLVLVAYGNSVYFSHYVLPLQEHVRSTKQYVEYYNLHRESEAKMLVYGRLRPTVLYYMGGAEHVTHFSRAQIDHVIRMAKQNPHIFIIGRKKYTDRLLRRLRTRTQRPWYIVGASNHRFDLLASRKAE